MPSISDNIPALEIIIEEILEIHYNFNTALEYFSTPKALFFQPHELNPTELAGAETTPSDTQRDNGMTPSVLTHPSLPNSPLVDAPELTASTPPHTHAGASATARIGGKRNF